MAGPSAILATTASNAVAVSTIVLDMKRGTYPGIDGVALVRDEGQLLPVSPAV